jgi:hypothetical protein
MARVQPFTWEEMRLVSVTENDIHVLGDERELIIFCKSEEDLKKIMHACRRTNTVLLKYLLNAVTLCAIFQSVPKAKAKTQPNPGTAFFQTRYFLSGPINLRTFFPRSFVTCSR